MAENSNQATPVVTAEAGIDINLVTSSVAYKNWLASIDTQRLTVHEVHIQSVDMFGQKVGFIKFKAKITDANGKVVPGIIFMRGGAVAMLPVLNCEGEKFTILTVQARVATGKGDFAETPAGMLDGSGNFAGVAAKEIEEELGLKILASDLVDLTDFAGYDGGFFVSPGGSDETIRVFAFFRDVTKEELAEFNGKCTGLLAEGEQITLKIIPLEDLWKVNDGKSIVAYTLYQKFVNVSS